MGFMSDALFSFFLFLSLRIEAAYLSVLLFSPLWREREARHFFFFSFARSPYLAAVGRGGAGHPRLPFPRRSFSCGGRK